MKIQNKKAYFNYQVIETWVAGIMLQGTEIKSVVKLEVNFADSYAYINGNEVFLKGLSISQYDKGSYNNHIPDRERKLLLKKKEIDKIKSLIDKGLTLIALSIFTNERGKCKIELGLCKGKKVYDKREDIKKKDQQREQERNV